MQFCGGVSLLALTGASPNYDNVLSSNSDNYKIAENRVVLASRSQISVTLYFYFVLTKRKLYISVRHADSVSKC